MNINALNLIKLIQNNRLRSDLHIAISHRGYLQNDGGIEHCLRRESMLAITQQGVDYLHLCPTQVNHNDISFLPSLDVTLNNQFIGTVTLDGLTPKIQALRPTLVLLHSAINFPSGGLLRLLLTLKRCGILLQWIHDLSFTCNSITLLRDGIFCGLPRLDEIKCGGCQYQDSRASLHFFYKQLANLAHGQLFPSITAKNRYNTTLFCDNHKSKQLVIPHYFVDCNEGNHSLKKIYAVNKPLGIAFFGNTVAHKGWNEYVSIVDVFYRDDDFKFYQVGIEGIKDERINFIHFSEISCDEPLDKLYFICKQNNIKIAFFWSTTLESFGIMLRQILTTSCSIVCKNNDESLKEFISNDKKLLYFDTIDNVIKFLQNRQSLQAFLELSYNLDCSLQVSNMSYDAVEKINDRWQLINKLA
jgi:hypothetical protein